MSVQTIGRKDNLNTDVVLAEEENMVDEFEDRVEEDESGYIELSDNEVVLRFSVTLMNKLKRAAVNEGIELDELASELITEALAQRAVVDSQRGNPSHLMTRTGYVPPDAQGQTTAQPYLSHHLNMPNHLSNQNRNNGNRRANQKNKPRSGQRRSSPNRRPGRG